MQSTISKLRFAGDVELKDVQINSLNGQVANVTAQVMGLEIYEDMFSPFMTVSLVLRESVDYINLFPFVGEEFIDLEVVTPDIARTIKGRFYIYRITDREYTKDKEVVYAIKAISEEFLTDANSKINRSFSGNISEIAKSLIDKEGLSTGKPINIDPSINTTKFTANFWNPTKCLYFLSSAATDTKGMPAFMFFENRDGFNFKSVDQLLTKRPYQEFKKDNYTRTLQNDGVNSIKDPTEDFKRIIDISVPVMTDYMADIQTGKIKSRMLNHDILTKKYTVKDYSIKKDTIKPNWLNDNPSYSKYALANAASTMINIPKYYNNFTNIVDVTNAKTTQRRLSFFQMLNSHKVTIQVFGRTDYTIGQIVNLDIPRATQLFKNETDPRDLILSGNYLVSAINHTITRESHTCTMELVKNSVLVNLSK